MPHSTHWLAEQRVFYVCYFDEVSPEEIRDLIYKTEPIVSSLKGIVHIIVDYSLSPKFHISFHKLIESDAAKLQFQGSNVGWTIAVAPENWQYIHLLEHVVKTHLGGQMETVQSIDDAIQFLHKQDASLPAFQMPPE